MKEYYSHYNKKNVTIISPELPRRGCICPEGGKSFAPEGRCIFLILKKLRGSRWSLDAPAPLELPPEGDALIIFNN
jgi:hypothetical protein